jgi:hypothetical protein
MVIALVNILYFFLNSHSMEAPSRDRVDTYNACLCDLVCGCSPALVIATGEQAEATSDTPLAYGPLLNTATEYIVNRPTNGISVTYLHTVSGFCV